MTPTRHFAPPLSEMELEQIRQRLRAASPGPWCHREGFIETCTDPSVLLSVTMKRSEAGLSALPSWENAEFIAHARTDVPRLLAEIERLRGILAQSAFADDGKVTMLPADGHDSRAARSAAD